MLFGISSMHKTDVCLTLILLSVLKSNKFKNAMYLSPKRG